MSSSVSPEVAGFDDDPRIFGSKPGGYGSRHRTGAMCRRGYKATFEEKGR